MISRSIDRKSTRLNSSHLVISYAVFCFKKKHFHTFGGERGFCWYDSLPLCRPRLASSDTSKQEQGVRWPPAPVSCVLFVFFSQRPRRCPTTFSLPGSLLCA